MYSLRCICVCKGSFLPSIKITIIFFFYGLWLSTIRLFICFYRRNVRKFLCTYAYERMMSSKRIISDRVFRAKITNVRNPYRIPVAKWPVNGAIDKNAGPTTQTGRIRKARALGKTVFYYSFPVEQYTGYARRVIRISIFPSTRIWRSGARLAGRFLYRFFFSSTRQTNRPASFIIFRSPGIPRLRAESTTTPPFVRPKFVYYS